jgi:hypothetical protein
VAKPKVKRTSAVTARPAPKPKKKPAPKARRVAAK